MSDLQTSLRLAERKLNHWRRDAEMWQDLCVTLTSLLLKKYSDRTGGEELTPDELYTPMMRHEAQIMEARANELIDELIRRFL